MNQIRPMHRLAIAAIALIAAACSDAPTVAGPQLSPPTATVYSVSAAPGHHLGTHAVTWAARHDKGQHSVSGFITAAAGGTISVPAADLTITFPAGALSQDLTITVVAVGGKSVAYDFLPHGIQFNKQVVVTQGLANTSVGGLTGLIPKLYGAYLPEGKETISDAGFALAAEIVTSSTIFSSSGAPATHL